MTLQNFALFKMADPNTIQILDVETERDYTDDLSWMEHRVLALFHFLWLKIRVNSGCQHDLSLVMTLQVTVHPRAVGNETNVAGIDLWIQRWGSVKKLGGMLDTTW